MITVVASQPMLFPWPGFFEQLSLADVYIDADDMQFSKGSRTNRIQIKWGNERRWLTVPIMGSGAFQPISQLRATDERWRPKHRALLAQSLKGAPFRDHALGILDAAYAHERLYDLLSAGIAEAASYLGISPKRWVRTSELNVEGRSSARALALVRSVGGTRYITGHGAANYLEHGDFEAAGVAIEYMRYSLTPWPQGGASFSPYVSILDLIGWTGPRAAEYLRPSTVGWRTFLLERAPN
jgi:hypothetical protein